MKNQLSSELALQIGIRLMEEDETLDSRKWLLRTMYKTRSVIDSDCTKKIPSRYLEILDKNTLVRM